MNDDTSPRSTVTNKKNILVTGANGQLGMELRSIAQLYPGYHFIFSAKDQLPIENVDAINRFFDQQPIDFCINCAAYTAVDKAETEKEKAFLVNGTAVGELATACKIHNIQLIHISTDYVFRGDANKAYLETDPTDPVNSYGESKLKGEQLALQNDASTIIIRTSWLYSSFGNNFVKTILHLMREKDRIKVVNDQYGCPTYAADLAGAIMLIVEKLAVGNGKSALPTVQPLIYNYSNAGVTNWYEFALAIKELSGSQCLIEPVPTSEYPTAAKRPQYSVLDTIKIRDQFQVSVAEWTVSLKKCLSRLKTH